MSDHERNRPKEITNFRRALPQFLAVGVKNLLLFGYGMTLGFPTIVIPAIQGGDGRETSEHHHDIVLSREEISWFSSINLLCVPLGCIFSGVFTQPIGKRTAMQLVNLPILAAWLLFYFSTNIYHLYAGLCLAGLMGGLMEAPVLTYVAEITDPRFRGMLAATGSTCVIFGVFTQFLMGTFLKWRTIAAISTIFPVLSILALFFVPESPHWLLVKGRYEEAKRSLAWLRGWTSLNDIEQEYESIYEVIVRQPAAQRLLDSGSNQSDCSRQAGLYAKKSFLVPYALVTLTFFIGHFSGKTPLQTYAVQIFHTLKAPIDKYYATVLLGAVEIVGTLVCVILVHYTGKRPLVLVSTVGCGLCFLGTATYAHFLDLVPGVSVDNVVANVSALDKGNLISVGNVAHAIELNEQLMVSGILNDSWPKVLGLPRNESDDEAMRFERSTALEDGNGPVLLFAGNSSSDPTFDYDFNGTAAEELLMDNDFLSMTVNYTYTEYEEYPDENRHQNASQVLSTASEDSQADRIIPDEIVLQIPKVDENRFIWLPLTLLLLSAMFAHMGIKLIPWMLIGEVFPSSVRSGASGISGGTGYVFGFLSNKLFLHMLATLTLPGTFWFYSAVALVGAVVLYFVLPETEGRSLIEIEQHFSGGKRLNSKKHGGDADENDGGGNLSRAHDHVTVIPAAGVTTTAALMANSNCRVRAAGNKNGRAPVKMELSNWDGNRIFQKHLEEHKHRLDVAGNKANESQMFSINQAKRRNKIMVEALPQQRTIYSTHL